MNNEEIILQMLEKLTENVSGLRTDVDLLKEDLAILKKDNAILKEDNASIKETLARVAVTQENFVLPRLDLLAEGQTALRATLAPKDATEKRLDTLESDVSALKMAVRSHADKLAQLPKAQ